MKGSSLLISCDYKGLYDSSCDRLKKSIINALGEIFIITGLETFAVDRGCGVKVNDEEFIGISSKKGYINFVIASDEKVRYVKICDNQKDKTFKMFDSDINNWITFVEKMKEELNKGLI